MTRLHILFLLWATELAGFSQSLPFPYGGIIPKYTTVPVRWKASKYPWPKQVWTYQMMRAKFSPTTISNLLSLAGFTEKDRWGAPNPNGVAYFNWKDRLRISFATGEIELDRELNRYSPTNLAKDVPETNELFQLTTNFLPKLGIDVSEIPKTKNGKFQIRCTEPSHTYYSVGDATITNIEYRTGSFGRLIDGIQCDLMVGSCTINFGEHSQIKGINLYWRNVRHDKLYLSATPKEITQWIHDGKIALPRAVAFGGNEPMAIDWSTAKRITINDAEAHYYGDTFLGEREQRPIFPSPVVPYGVLDSTIDFGKTNLNLKILCPIFDGKKPTSDSEETTVRVTTPH